MCSRTIAYEVYAMRQPDVNSWQVTQTHFTSLPWSQVYKSNTWECRLLLQTFVTEWVALRSSVDSIIIKYSTVNC